MNTIEKINVVELASELANKKLVEYSETLSEKEFTKIFPQGLQVETEDETRYTEEAQDLFNEYYDDFYDIIETCVDNF